MTRSASTPRLRLTQFYYLALLAASGVTGQSAEWLPATAAGGALMDVVAILLVASGCLGRIWCSTFIAGRKDAELVTTGPYSLCRHPLYSLSVVSGLGLGLATHSASLTLVTLLVLSGLFLAAARREERQLAQWHGAAFREYRQQVPRFLPQTLRYTLPETTTVRLPIFRKAFRDAAVFLLLLALLLASSRLRDAGILPTLWRLP